MLNNVNTNVERIIAKIDNDFNPDHSDWIPRVGAWAIDAMSTLKVLKKEPKRRKLSVTDRIAYSPCTLNAENLTVYDSNGCKVDKADNQTSKCGCSSTGEGTQSDTETLVDISNTTDFARNNNANSVPDYTVFQSRNEKEYPPRYNVYNYMYGDHKICKNYVLSGCNQIELNFDDEFIYIESNEVVTECSSIYGCDLPVIPNNGLLIEAIAAWCMYKMLCRGYKHVVFNLRDNSPATNPYIAWLTLKEQAKTSLIIDAQGDIIDDKGQWNLSFYNFTFSPKLR